MSFSVFTSVSKDSIILDTMNLFIKKILSEKETQALLFKSFEEISILQMIIKLVRELSLHYIPELEKQLIDSLEIFLIL